MHSIQEALENAAIMIVFITPSSLRSNWIYFECGYAYSKGIRVVPVGFMGVDLGTLSPPLSLLQGFNITSKEGLSNLVAITNDVFGHSHDARFTAEEFIEICSSSGASAWNAFGDYGALVDYIYVRLSQEDLDFELPEAFHRIENMLQRSAIEYTSSTSEISLHGIMINLIGGTSPHIDILIDPGVSDIAFPIVEKAIREVRTRSINGISVVMHFIQAVDHLVEGHKVTGRIYGSDIKMTKVDHFIFQDIEFVVSHSYKLIGRGDPQPFTYLHMTLNCNEIPLSQIRELVQFLFDRAILYVDSGAVG